MKYIKTYEGINKGLQIGDYVICNEKYQSNTSNVGLSNFLENNIGQIADFRNIFGIEDNLEDEFQNIPARYSIFVKYENIPDEIEGDFYYHKNITSCRIFSFGEIKHHSKNREDLEYIIAAKKYNI